MLDVEAVVRKAAGLPERKSQLDKEVDELQLTAGPQPASLQPTPPAEPQSEYWSWKGIEETCTAVSHWAVALPNGGRYFVAREGCSCWRKSLHRHAGILDDVAVVRKLLQAKADPNYADSFGSFTALHKAAMWGSNSTAQVLLEFGADVDPASRHDLLTPLHRACSPHRDGTSKRKVINLLLQQGASPTALTIRGE